MPDDYRRPNIVEAYQMYYMMDKMHFARFTPKTYFDTRSKDALIADIDNDTVPRQFKDSIV